VAVAELGLLKFSALVFSIEGPEQERSDLAEALIANELEEFLS
jgi:hypothetical protein